MTQRMNQRPLDTQRPLDANKPQSILKSVHEGMEVYDSANKKAGKVKELYFGASSDEMMRHGPGAATAPDPSLRDNSLIDDIARGIFDSTDVPEEMQQRLINDGFIRIDAAGIFTGDRFVLPEQIDHVDGNNVYLNISRDGLLKR